jgi:GNAT superfamily N-acetyltransferase
MNFSVTLAGDEHLAAIGPIELAAATMFSEADLPSGIRYRVSEPSFLRDAQKDSRIWVALTGSRVPVGFALATLVNDEAHLDEVDVLPNYGQQGIGTELVNAVANWARSSGHSSLTLITFRHLPWNAPFYEKLGFVRLRTAELSVGLAELIEEEGKAGIDVSKRIGMRMTLREDVKGR